MRHSRQQAWHQAQIWLDPILKRAAGRRQTEMSPDQLLIDSAR